ncbi:terminase [Edwardsiella hoshinae]|uniref:Terminase n=1 Tax=Edwardsiella hoshinae TaxID=93378 RepID=A0A376DMT2_9GAMM|nr:phage terminase small subunit [Edwardsiella hoshinae]AOV98012.1 terminase [Edwardsiella hoshinae]QPR29110.1 terminase [Edwardsiella hoshinae]STC91401.1 Phage small terminase subunit [Edwardsiella hoshinae]
MLSPAECHVMRVSATLAAQRENTPLRHASEYEQMLVKLAADRRKLKGIQSVETKALHKRDMLPFYGPWISGVLAAGRGAQDDIVMTVMLWRFDVDDITGALDIAEYALRHNLRMPEKHSRTTGCVVVEETAAAAARLRAAGAALSIDTLERAIALTVDQDMPDNVRARLHKTVGLLLRDQGDNAAALAQLQRAMQLDDNAGVKKEIQALERAIRPKPVKQPAKPAKKKTAARPRSVTGTPARRGRPPKVKAAS